MWYKSKILTLETMAYSWYVDEYISIGQEAVFTHINVILDCLGQVCILVELPVQRRFYPIFVRNVKSPDFHECFRGLTGSQQTPRFWGVTAWYQSIGIRLPRA